MIQGKIETTKNALRGRKVLTARFDSCGAFADACRSLKAGTDAHASWWGGDSRSALLGKCEAGDDRFVAPAMALLEKINAEIEIPRPQWQPSVYGAFPNVPEALAGEIECMRHLQLPQEESTPIRIYYDPTSSAAIDAKDLQSRGCAALALVMALSAIRPVELWCFSDLDAHGTDHANVMVKIQSAPLMVSEACYMMCNPGFARCLMYGYAEKTMGFHGMWGFGDHCEDATARARLMAASLNASPQDLVIPGISVRDEMVKDPVGWVNRQLARLAHVREHGGWGDED
jgi:hypothetical protein